MQFQNEWVYFAIQSTSDIEISMQAQFNSDVIQKKNVTNLKKAVSGEGGDSSYIDLDQLVSARSKDLNYK